MKYFYSLSILLFVLLLFSCGEKKKEATEVTIGMTYEEVEGVLGKPASILRGRNELDEVTGLSEDELKVINMDTVDYKMEKERWLVPHDIKTTDESMYVTWIFDSTKTDRFYVLHNNYKEGTETSTKKVPVYYLGDKKVSKEEYDASDGYVYKLKDGSTVTKEEYLKKTGQKTKIPEDSLRGKQQKMKKLPKGKRVEKRIEYVTKTSTSSKEVIESVDKVYYEVEYKLCAVFDASSNRVTEYDFVPVSVKEVKED